MADTPNAPAYTTPQTFLTRSKLFSWTLNGVSTGVPIKVSDWSDKTVQAFASAWGSATLVWEGSDDVRADPAHADYASAVYKTLTDTTETALSATADTDVIQVLQNPIWIRPKTTGGTGSTITANLSATKQ